MSRLPICGSHYGVIAGVYMANRHISAGTWPIQIVWTLYYILVYLPDASQSWKQTLLKYHNIIINFNNCLIYSTFPSLPLGTSHPCISSPYLPIVPCQRTSFPRALVKYVWIILLQLCVSYLITLAVCWIGFLYISCFLGNSCFGDFGKYWRPIDLYWWYRLIFWWSTISPY